jgi:hypothetical protein
LWANGNDALDWLQWLIALFSHKVLENGQSALSVNRFVQRYLTTAPTFVSFRLTIVGGLV